MTVSLFNSTNCQDSACIPPEYLFSEAHGRASFLALTPEQTMNVLLVLMIIALIVHITIERGRND